MNALLRLGRAVRTHGGDPWRWRIPILARASDLVHALLSAEPLNPAPLWRQLGLIEWESSPDLMHPPPGPADTWDPATGLSWARATYCFRRALAAKPDDAPALRSLAECFGVRRMADAKRKVELASRRQDPHQHPLIFGVERPGSTAALSWSAADQLAVEYLHLGEPDSARRIWNETPAPAPLSV